MCRQAHNPSASILRYFVLGGGFFYIRMVSIWVAAIVRYSTEAFHAVAPAEVLIDSVSYLCTMLNCAVSVHPVH